MRDKKPRCENESRQRTIGAKIIRSEQISVHAQMIIREICELIQLLSR